LEHTVLLAGFAFEAYNDPVGGTRDEDAFQGSTTYLSRFVQEAFAGVLEVKLVSASELAAGDVTGQSDPYVMLSVNGSAARSRTQRFTRSPTWNETLRLFVRDPGSDTLRLRVMDEDFIKEDDTLGVALLSLADLADGNAHELDVPVVGGGVGPGGGTLRLTCRYFAFSTPSEPRWAEDTCAVDGPWALPSLAAALPSADASKWLDSLVRSATSMVASALDAPRVEAERRRAEEELWAVPRSSDWAVLASTGPGSRTLLPSEFEKVAFVANAKTDTQCCIWRCVARRTLVIAFRGTETSKLRDIITDARLAPRSFTPERVASSRGGRDEVAVHDGFLEAFDSVRPRVFSAVDDAIGAGPRAEALGWRSATRDAASGWRIWVTGHSLGGALATLCALELAASVEAGKRRGLDVCMVNFGSPRVGNAAFVELYNSLVPHSCRLVNGTDAVPTVPALLGYRHVAHGVRLTSHGVASPDTPPTLPSTSASPGDIVSFAAAALSGAVSAGAVDETAAAEAAVALASLVDAAALEAHFEEQYLQALRTALKARTDKK